MLNPGDFTFSPSAALCSLSSVSSFLVQHSARGEDKVHNSDQSSVVSAPEEKGMEAEMVFLMRNKGEELYSLRQGMLEAAQAKLRMKRLRINNVLLLHGSATLFLLHSILPRVLSIGPSLFWVALLRCSLKIHKMPQQNHWMFLDRYG